MKSIFSRWIYIIDSFYFVFWVGEDDFELVDFHETDHVMIANVCEYSVFIEMFDLHDQPFLNKEEIFSFSPSVLGGIAVYFPFFQKLLILLVQLQRNGDFLGRVVTFV